MEKKARKRSWLHFNKEFLILGSQSCFCVATKWIYIANQKPRWGRFCILMCFLWRGTLPLGDVLATLVCCLNNSLCSDRLYAHTDGKMERKWKESTIQTAELHVYTFQKLRAQNNWKSQRMLALYFPFYCLFIHSLETHII